LGSTPSGTNCGASGSALKKTTHAAEQDRPDVAAARQLWRREQPQWDLRRLVFIDETALNTKMARLDGWSRRGQRCLGTVPQGHWATSTFIAALRHDRIDAPFLIEGSANMEVFAAYVGQVLCPQLQEGDEVIMDNLCIHKTPVVTRLIKACGATVRFLPPYSPDLNPIEMAFAKLKSHLRHEAARTLETLQPAVARSLSCFHPDHCQGFFRHAQYGTS
jgi:transposase